MAHRCIKCGIPIVGTEVLYNGKIFCVRCTNTFGTCAMCQNGMKCEFQTNPPQFLRQLQNESNIKLKEE